MIRYCKKSTRFFPKIVCTCDAPLVFAIKKSLNPLFYKEFSDSLSCRQPESNRYGRLVPQDFKSCASASSATAAYKMNRDNLLSRNGTNRARTYDPLLVRQMLSQLSYDPEN